MAETLLRTKLTIPPLLPNLVPRSRLIDRLNQGQRSGCQITLIAAPAGYGKTILAGSWLRLIDRSCAWLSLDEDDNDPVRFWTYLLTALQAAGVDRAGDGLAMIQSPQRPPFTAVLSALVNELAALPGPIILVLDDYHVIHNQVIHEGIGFLIKHQPSQLHLTIATRADPPLPLARLRGRRALMEIRSDDLRFSSEEAKSLLNDIMALELSAGDIEALASRTEGWAVGLVLAAQSVQGREDKQAFIDAFSGSHHYILEYLVGEVLNQQPEAIRGFLLKTSLLSRFCGPLCNAVTDHGHSQQILKQLQLNNLFIVPLDDEGRWFRFHHLFTDLLGNLRRQELPPVQVRDLHRRASQWFEQNGDLNDAVGHALRSEDFELAAGLIERSTLPTIAQGRLITFLNWLAALPETLLLARPRLRIHQAWALHLSGDYEVAEQVLQSTRESQRSALASAENEALLGQIAAMLVGIATMHEDMATVIREAKEAFVYLPEGDLVSRARVHIALGTASAYSDDFEQAVSSWKQARTLALASNNPFLAAAAVELLAGTRIYHQGRLQSGAHLLRQIIALGTTKDGALLPFTAVAHVLLAEVYLEWNDLQSAARCLEIGIHLMKQGGIAHGLIHAYCAKARLGQALFDVKGASEALAIAEQALDGQPLWHMIVHQIACQVRYRLWIGDVTGAGRWAIAEPAVIGRDLNEDLPIYLGEVQQLSLARVHLARDEVVEALVIFDKLLPAAIAAGRLAIAAEALLYRALALRRVGDLLPAIEAFEQCLSITEVEGRIRLFVEAGEPALALLRQAASRGISPIYVARLLAAFETSLVEPGPRDRRQEEASLVDPLSARESQVLCLIGDGYTNREIANTLIVTLNTVKKHTGSIYSKLGVHSRTQAVARARELGLL